MFCFGKTQIGKIIINVGNPDWLDQKLNPDKTNLPYYSVYIQEYKQYNNQEFLFYLDLHSDTRFPFIDFRKHDDKIELEAYNIKKSNWSDVSYGYWKLSRNTVERIFDKCLEIERLSDTSRYTSSFDDHDIRCNKCGNVFDKKLIAEHICNPKIANVADRYKDWTKDLIKEDLSKNALPVSVLMQALHGDYNLGSIVRSTNAFGCKEVFYCGNKHLDRRSCVGTHHYTKITYLESFDQIKNLKEKYTIVALENNLKFKPHKLQDFKWPTNKDVLIMVGEEGCGISEELLNLADFAVEIPLLGSVRSLNVASACTVALYDFMAKYQNEVK